MTYYAWVRGECGLCGGLKWLEVKSKMCNSCIEWDAQGRPL